LAKKTKLPNNLEQQNYLSTNKKKAEGRENNTKSKKSLHINPVAVI
jgi:hypothetical protein